MSILTLAQVPAMAQLELSCRVKAKEAAQLAFKSCMTGESVRIQDTLKKAGTPPQASLKSSSKKASKKTDLQPTVLTSKADKKSDLKSDVAVKAKSLDETKTAAKKAAHENKIGTKLPKKLIPTKISETLAPTAAAAVEKIAVSESTTEEDLIEQEIKEQNLEMSVTLKSEKDMKFDQEPALPLEKVNAGAVEPVNYESIKTEMEQSEKTEEVSLQTEATIQLD